MGVNAIGAVDCVKPGVEDPGLWKSGLVLWVTSLVESYALRTNDGCGTVSKPTSDRIIGAEAVISMD
jgi:hypothetical protein